MRGIFAGFAWSVHPALVDLGSVCVLDCKLRVRKLCSASFKFVSQFSPLFKMTDKNRRQKAGYLFVSFLFRSRVELRPSSHEFDQFCDCRGGLDCWSRTGEEGPACGSLPSGCFDPLASSVSFCRCRQALLLSDLL